MTKRKKDSKDGVGTSLRGLLRDVEVEAPKPANAPAPIVRKKERLPASGKPSDGLRGNDRIAFMDAMVGVRAVKGAPPPNPIAPRAPVPVRADDAEARARLGALVAGAIRFDIERKNDTARGVRTGSSPSILRSLASRDFHPDATLDLHGMRGDEAEAEIVRFVRAEHRRGLRRVLIITGKGLHSEGGLGVLGDRALHALTAGGAAPLVLAFSSAHEDHGGRGALAVELTR